MSVGLSGSGSHGEAEKVVLVTDYTWASVEPEAEVLAASGARIVVAETGEEDELVRLAPQADGILTCFAGVTARVVAAAERLQVIGRYGIGVDNIAVDEATRRGIPVTNVPAYCLDEVAEHVLALILAHARSLLAYDRAVREGDWSLARGAPIHRVTGATLGIVGYGKIGQCLGAKARGLGLRTVAFDPNLSDEQIREYGAEPASLAVLAAGADYVSVHVPLTPDTRDLIDEPLLRSMKPTAFLVNTARGGIINQTALVRALAEGWIAGAGIDVFEPERLPADHPLLAQETLIPTPHVAFYSEESVKVLEILAAENVAAILDGRRPASVVNAEVLELPKWAHLR
jgi:D-3-phosphoglycerate dehydrogenase / 2-oxoglutarate reductase